MPNPAEPRLIGTSAKPLIEIRVEDLGRPGAVVCLSIVPQFLDGAISGRDLLDDTTPRQFVVSGRLSKEDSMLWAGGIIKGNFDRTDGASYLWAPPGATGILLETSWGECQVKTNDSGELSIIEFQCIAGSFLEARTKFITAVYPMLDHLSFAYDHPMYLTTIRVFDIVHQTTQIVVTSPYRNQVISDNLSELFVEIRPIYSMYREAEAKNANSYFYRFLCLYKIMEGLLGDMRSSAYRRAKQAGVDIKNKAPVVPDDPELSNDLRQYAGKSIKSFFDKVLTAQFRHAVAHLQTKDHVLDVSSPAERDRFTGLALVTDLCARALIVDHERILAQLPPSPPVQAVAPRPGRPSRPP